MRGTSYEAQTPEPKLKIVTFLAVGQLVMFYQIVDDLPVSTFSTLISFWKIGRFSGRCPTSPLCEVEHRGLQQFL
jgi:hypothetical protein